MYGCLVVVLLTFVQANDNHDNVQANCHIMFPTSVYYTKYVWCSKKSTSNWNSVYVHFFMYTFYRKMSLELPYPYFKFINAFFK